MTAPQSISPDIAVALADRIDATKRSWLPIAGHVVNVTFNLAEADIITAALRATQPAAPSGGEAQPDGYNGCYRQAIAALNYLAQYPRPVGGQSQFNAEHLLQIADEMKRSRRSDAAQGALEPTAEGDK